MKYNVRRTFVITGTSRGLGNALVSRIIENSNYKIYSISRTVTELQKSYPSGRFEFCSCDLSKPLEVEEKLSQLHFSPEVEEIIFINNASVILPISSVGSFVDQDVNSLISVNLNSPIIICNYLIQHFSHLNLIFINISSGAASNPILGWALYCSTKSGMKMFFEVLALEFPKFQFLNINPGVIDTGMQREIRSSNFERVNEFIKYKKEGLLKSPQEVAIQILKDYL